MKVNQRCCLSGVEGNNADFWWVRAAIAVEPHQKEKLKHFPSKLCIFKSKLLPLHSDFR